MGGPSLSARVPVTLETLRARIDQAPMSRAQIAAVAMTVLIAALDGYDVLSVTFAAPAIARAWAIDRATVGLLLSAGLAGMALGSFFVAPLADRFGRRKVILANLALMAIGMSASACAPGFGSLGFARVITGVGIGAMVAVINPLAAEYANARRRPLAMSIMNVGYPLGGFVGGSLAALLLAWFGWRMVFVAGGVAAALIFPLVLVFLPEPPGFLLTRQPPPLATINALLERWGQASIRAIKVRVDAPSGRSGYRLVFAPGQRRIALRLALANLLYGMAVYFMLSWFPQLVVNLGFAPSTASMIAATSSLAGVVGGVALGWLAQAGRLRRLTIGAMVLAGVSCMTIGAMQRDIALILAVAAACGFFLFAGIAGLYATLASSFALKGRASGMGFVIGAGRIASAIAPVLAGWLFGKGAAVSAVSMAFGLCAVAAGLIVGCGNNHHNEGSQGANP